MNGQQLKSAFNILSSKKFDFYYVYWLQINDDAYMCLQNTDSWWCIQMFTEYRFIMIHTNVYLLLVDDDDSYKCLLNIDDDDDPVLFLHLL